MCHCIKTTSGGDEAVVMSQIYDDYAKAVGVAQRLHEMEHIELGAHRSDAVELRDDNNSIVRRRSTASDYLGLKPETF